LAKVEAQSDVRWNGDDVLTPTSYFPDVNNVGVRPEEIVLLNLKDTGTLVYGRQLDADPIRVEEEEEFLRLCQQLRPKGDLKK
jgi:hypothetical protein